MKATLGDQTYRVPRVDEWTNLFYLAPAFLPMPYLQQLAVVPAAIMLCAGSWLWHRREGVMLRRLDELGMMMMLSSTAAVLLGRVSGIEAMPLLSIPVWAVYYNVLHKTSSFHHIGGWAAFILAVLVTGAGWAPATIPLGLLTVALWGQFGFPWDEARYEHGPRHGLVWHVGTALAIFSIFVIY